MSPRLRDGVMLVQMEVYVAAWICNVHFSVDNGSSYSVYSFLYLR